MLSIPPVFVIIAMKMHEVGDLEPVGDRVELSLRRHDPQVAHEALVSMLDWRSWCGDFREPRRGNTGGRLLYFKPLIDRLIHKYWTLAQAKQSVNPIYLFRSNLDVRTIRGAKMEGKSSRAQRNFLADLQSLIKGDGDKYVDQDGLHQLLLSLDPGEDGELQGIVSQPDINCHLNTALTDVAWQALLDDQFIAADILKHLQSVRGLLIGKSDIVRSILETCEDALLFGEDETDDTYIRQLERLEPGLDQHVRIHILGTRIHYFLATFEGGDWDEIMAYGRDLLQDFAQGTPLRQHDLETVLDLMPAQ